jgi:tetratricopeptide (TPR) repeat protein
VLSDGSEPPDRATIERVCTTSVKSEGYTDNKGHFSFSIGDSAGVLPDASTNERPGAAQLGLGGLSAGNSLGDFPGSVSESADWDCDLRARLAGFRSESVSLAGRRVLENPDIGRIVLYPLSKIEGLTVSATSEQAPKNARKAYENGLDAAKKNKPDQAEQEFRKAVDLYPKYAAALLELGKTLERRDKFPEARALYEQALAADPKYLYPHQRLYLLAFRDRNWHEVADHAEQLIRLDPFEFPDAYYFDGVAHFQLKEYEAAEKSARKAVEIDRRESNPKSRYLLGVVLLDRNDLTGAGESLRAYLKAAPDAPDRAEVEKVLRQIDDANRTSDRDARP